MQNRKYRFVGEGKRLNLGTSWLVASQTGLVIEEKSTDLQFRKDDGSFAFYIYTCEEPASIFPEPVDPSTFDMATLPSFGKDELDIDQRHLFTDSIVDWLRCDGAVPKCCSCVGSIV
jgi:hypothetical protein